MSAEADSAVIAQMRLLLKLMDEIRLMEDEAQLRLIRDKIKELKEAAEIGWL